MKIALFLSGDLRCFDECYESLYYNIIDKTKCDIYMQVNDSEKLADAIKLYKPKKIKITYSDDIIKFDTSKYQFKMPETNPLNVFYMWRGIKESFSLIDDTYDFYIKCRYDIKFENQLDIHTLNSDEINIPSGGDWRGGLMDMFSITNFINMKYYTSMFDHIDEYYEKYRIVFHPENLLKFHLRDSAIKRFHYPIIFRRKYDGSSYYSDRLFTV